MGGYYNSGEGRAEVQAKVRRFNEDGFHGDFYSHSYVSGGNKFDMTEFHAHPGMWTAIGRDLQEYIRNANMGTTFTNTFCRGEESSVDVDGLLNLGFEYGYIFPASDGQTYLFVSPDAMCYQGHVLVGDFTALYEQLKADYSAGLT